MLLVENVSSWNQTLEFLRLVAGMTWGFEREDFLFVGFLLFVLVVFFYLIRPYCFMKSICWVSKIFKLWICRRVAKNYYSCCWNIPFHESGYWFITLASLLKRISPINWKIASSIWSWKGRCSCRNLVFSCVLFNSSTIKWRTNELFCNF